MMKAITAFSTWIVRALEAGTLATLPSALQCKVHSPTWGACSSLAFLLTESESPGVEADDLHMQQASSR